MEFFTPGQDGSFAWNTTAPIGKRPILVYVYDCQKSSGDGFDYSQSVERKIFSQQEIRKLSRDFVCEKICAGNDEFLRKVEGREAVSSYLSTMKEPKDRVTHVAVLDPEGKLIAKFTEPKLLKKGAPAFLELLKGAQVEAARRKAEGGEGSGRP